MKRALRLEHVAFNVADPEAVAAWYVAHFGLRIARRNHDAARTHFLATADGVVLLEFYNNPAAPIPPYAEKHYLELHLAFASADPETDARRLIAAGATVADSFKVIPCGDRMIMLRDPFGLCVQLVQRQVSLLP
ncbi:MAG: VOC family protein [Opitutae bacterium]|nr:VOC family protein [Opitutae bacterium]